MRLKDSWPLGEKRFRIECEEKEYFESMRLQKILSSEDHEIFCISAEDHEVQAKILFLPTTS